MIRKVLKGMSRKKTDERKRIAFFVSARSEYGLLRWTIKNLIESQEFLPGIFVGGGMTAASYGMSVTNIYEDFPDVEIFEIPYSLDGDTPKHIANSLSVGLQSMAQNLFKWGPDFIIILGDRYDIFIPSIAGTIGGIPIIHLCGGDITSGALDNNVRYSATKLSHIHLVQTFGAAKNVSSCGEEDWRISIVGAPGIESIYKEDFPSREIAEERLGIDLCKPTALCTYHPTTLEFNITIEQQVWNLLSALNDHEEFQFVITYPGVEIGSNKIIKMLKDFAEMRHNVHLFDSLGNTYLSVMKHSLVVIGNSSSGIIESPALQVPTVNIGTRQEGRERSDSIIDCGYDSEEISRAISKATTDMFRKHMENCSNPYDPYLDGNVSGRILTVLKNLPHKDKLLKKKLDFEVREGEWNRLLQ